MLSLKANKKMVQDKMAGMTGKVVLLKDLSNLSGKMKAGKTRNDLEGAVKQLTDKHGMCVYSMIGAYSHFSPKIYMQSPPTL